MLRFFKDANFDFIGRPRAVAATVALFIVPALIWVAIAGFNYSIEFTGGTLMQVEFEEDVDIGRLRSALSDAGVGNVELQTFGSANEIVIRAQDAASIEQQNRGAETVATNIRAGLDGLYGANGYTVVQTEAVGARVGSELRQNAIIALLISFAATLVYLAWRFEWRFGVAALIATLHDILATVAFMRYANIEVSLFVVGALLTVIGYSLNDTIVVFDRARENLKKYQKRPLADVANQSVNETLPRTVMTGTTTLATLLSLFIFGGAVIRPFALILIFGIIVGTLSSMFVAPSVLLWIARKYPRHVEGRGATRPVYDTTVPPSQAARPSVGAR